MEPTLKPLIAVVLAVFLVTSVTATESNPPTPLFSWLSLSELEQQLAQVDSELERLAPYSLRGGIGVIGYRSDWRGPTERQEWVEVELAKEYPIDEIVLVPTLRRDTHTGFRSDGFPAAFRILAGTADDLKGAVVAEYDLSDEIQPRIGPLAVPLKQVTASWVRIEATHLSMRAIDGKHVFQLAEVLLFSGMENVALRQSVKTSSHAVDRAGAWDKRFLVDGHTPYLMDSSVGSQSVAFVSRFGVRPNLYLDLGAEYPISRIHLHAVDQGDTVPQAYAGDLGIPNRLKIEGASNEDFTDAKTLLDYQRENINDMGPIMMWRIPETTCRFVRLIATEQDRSEQDFFAGSPRRDIRIGFAEVELYSKGNNVALGKRAYADDQPHEGGRSLSALTDGRNLFGKILPIRIWLDDLARRHDLEAERPRVVVELNRRYARQTVYLTWVTWLAALLAAGICLTFLIDRAVRLRQVAKLRSRFAADLHDELGANLHVIGLLSDLAQAAVDSPEKHQSIHQRLRAMTERSGDAVRYCTDMLEAQGLYEDLLEDMQRTTERVMADLKGDLSFQGDKEVVQGLKPRTRADLFLFYKECLVNISQHSEATHFTARLTASPEELCLIVSDDGHGLVDSSPGGVPPSLMRRAKLLGAKVTAQQPESGGTCITLTVPTRKWGFSK